MDGFAVDVRRVQTSDVSVMAEGMRRIYGGISQLALDDIEWSAHLAALGPVMLVQGNIEGHGRAMFYAGRHVLWMARSTPAEVQLDTSSSRAIPASHGIVFSHGQRAGIQSLSSLRTFNLLFDPAFVTAQMEALAGEPLPRGVVFENSLNLEVGAGAFLQRTCQYIFAQLADDPRQISPPLAASLCENLVRALLSGHAHSHSHLLDKPHPPSSRTIVRRVEEFLEANTGTPIVGSVLARVAGDSVSAVEAAFQRHRGMSPKAFLQRRRLERARQALLQDPFLNTARAAQMAGYLGVESFEGAYYRTFGETPAETRRRPEKGGLIVRSSPQADDAGARLLLLSPREEEVAERIVKGLLNKQIAAELGLTEKVVQKYRGRMMQKLGISSVAELVRLWERRSR